MSSSHLYDDEKSLPQLGLALLIIYLALTSGGTEHN